MCTQKKTDMFMMIRFFWRTLEFDFDKHIHPAILGPSQVSLCPRVMAWARAWCPAGRADAVGMRAVGMAAAVGAEDRRVAAASVPFHLNTQLDF